MQLTKIDQPTMTSLELVDFINGSRQDGEPLLRHRDFTAKVPKVLGDGVCEKFRAPYVNRQNGQTYQAYRFPKREACLMAMSYSYELQAKVYDHMTALEQAQQAPAIKDPALAAIMQSLVELDAVKQAQVQQGAKLVELEAKITTSPQDYYTIAGYANLRGLKVDTAKANLLGRKASKLSREYGVEIGSVHNAQYGTVHSYHLDVLGVAFENEG